jgi:cell division septum initiation protein DivIVA
VALDRQSIEKRDFPIGRRGYEPEAVDGHLAMVADEVETLRRSASRSTRNESLASAASEQVRLIVEAAEQSAADIEREAELEGRQIRQDAREAAERARSEAGQQSREHVEQVSAATASMLQRADALETELASLLETVRGGAGRLNQELQALQVTVGELRASTAGPAPQPAGRRMTLVEDPADDADFDFPPAAGDAPAAEPQLDLEPAPVAAVPDAAAGSAGDGDEEGARLIALNMALNGTPREETERYLADNFELVDAEALLDDVYARAGQ